MRYLGVLIMVLASGTVLQARSGDQPAVAFQTDIAPIFRTSCAPCHITAAMGKLKLDSEASVLKGGESGPALVAGHSADSLLVKRLLGTTDAPRMPMGGPPLSPDKVKTIRAWIDAGVFG